MKESSRPLLQTRVYTHASSTRMGISDGDTHSRAVMAPAPVPAAAPAPVPGHWSHCTTQRRVSRCAGSSRGGVVGLQPHGGHRQVVSRGPADRKPREGETRLKAHLLSDLQRKHCPQLFQPRCPAPANEQAGNEGWRDTRMPWHAPMPVPGSRHPFHLPRHARLPAPQGLVEPHTCGSWPWPQPVGQSPTPASPGGTGMMDFF